MTFDEVLNQIRTLLHQRGRVTYRSLRLRYQLDDDLLAGITDELVSAERVAVDEDGKVLIWVGKERNDEAEKQGKSEDRPESQVQRSALNPQCPAPRR